MVDAAGGWRADGDHHHGSGADRTDPANDTAQRERAPAMIPTSPSYQTGKGMSIIPRETGENFMNDDEKELDWLHMITNDDASETRSRLLAIIAGLQEREIRLLYVFARRLRENVEKKR